MASAYREGELVSHFNWYISREVDKLSSSLLDSIQNELNALLSESGMNSNNAWSPHVDIQTKDDEYVIYADIPGVNPNDVNITIDGNILTLQGVRYLETRDQKNGYSMVERFFGKFFRQFTLPNNIAQEDYCSRS